MRVWISIQQVAPTSAAAAAAAPPHCTETRSAVPDGKSSFQGKRRLPKEKKNEHDPQLTNESQGRAHDSSCRLKDVPSTAPADTSGGANIVSVNIGQVTLICHAAAYSSA